MGGNAQQPGSEAGVTAKAGQVLQRAQEGLLRHVLGVLLVAQHPQRQGIDPLLVTVSERLEGVQFTRLGASDQREVGQLMDRRVRHIRGALANVPAR